MKLELAVRGTLFLILLALVVGAAVVAVRAAEDKAAGNLCPQGQTCHWEMEQDTEAYVKCHPPKTLAFEGYGQNSGRLVCK